MLFLFPLLQGCWRCQVLLGFLAFFIVGWLGEKITQQLEREMIWMDNRMSRIERMVERDFWHTYAEAGG